MSVKRWRQSLLAAFYRRTDRAGLEVHHAVIRSGPNGVGSVWRVQNADGTVWVDYRTLPKPIRMVATSPGLMERKRKG